MQQLFSPTDVPLTPKDKYKLFRELGTDLISSTETPLSEDDRKFLIKGGVGSGNFGHAGRPGEVGGSAPSGSGRPVPIKVKSIDEAVKLVLEGKVVELPDVKSAATLIKRLAAMAIEAKAAGKEAKNYDLCRVSVKGTNLFCAARVRTAEFPHGISRIQMPQLSGTPIAGSEADKLPRIPGKDRVDVADAFIDHLTSLGIGISEDSVHASDLKSSQSELVGSAVAHLMLDRTRDLTASTYFVSNDNYIVDGHHRWAAAVGRDAEDGRLGDVDLNIRRIDAPITEILQIARRWTSEFGIAPIKGIREKQLKGGAGSGHFGHSGRVGEVGGSSPSGRPVTQTTSFKKWFKDSKVVDQNGDPLIVFHGSLRNDLEEFRTDKNTDWEMLDRALGTHFAEDPDVPTSFTISEYALPNDFAVSDRSGESWYRDANGLHYDGIPILIHGPRDNQSIVQYDPKIHGSTWGIADRYERGRLAVLPKGGTIYPVYLSIQNPLIVRGREREFDQSAISRTVGSLVFPKDRQLFVDAMTDTGRGNIAGAIWDSLAAGTPYDAGYERYESFEDVARNFTGSLNRYSARAKSILSSMGYDGVLYENTSNNEVRNPSDNRRTWIAFRPNQIKSAFAKQFDPSDPRVTKELFNTYVTGVTAGALMQPEPLQDAGPGTPHPITGRKFSSTEVRFPFETSEEIKEFGFQLIADDDIYELEGREDVPHVTVKYGLHAAYPDDLEFILEGVKPVKAIIGKTDIFEAEKYDVVFLSIRSLGLHRLNKLISEYTEVTDTQPSYTPHATLAYVKKGRGKKYIGIAQPELTGHEVEFDRIYFSNREDEEFEIALTGIVHWDEYKGSWYKGGAGSGHFGHSGREGLIGGSLPAGSSSVSEKAFTTYKINGQEADIDKYQQYLRDDTDLTLGELRRVFAVPDDAFQVNFDYDFENEAFTAEIIHPKFTAFDSLRPAYTDLDNKAHMLKKEYFEVGSEFRGQGLGTEIIQQQVSSLDELGIRTIALSAARGKDLIGYKVWPKLGFDGELKSTKAVNDKLAASKFKDVKTIQELYSTKEGRDWWAENGDDIKLTFDTRPNSRSRQILDAYIQQSSAKRGSGKKQLLITRKVMEPDLYEDGEEGLDRLWEENEFKGGVGSGNWGHAGRPGQVGGSASRSLVNINAEYATISEDDPEVFESEVELFHGTPAKNIDSIMKDGLVKDLDGIETTTGESAKVYLTYEHELARMVGAVASIMHDEGKFSIFKVSPEGIKLTPDPEAPGYGGIAKENVKPDNFESVYTFQLAPEIVEDIRTNVPLDDWRAVNRELMVQAFVRGGLNRVVERVGATKFPEPNLSKMSDPKPLYGFVIGDGVERLEEFIRDKEKGGAGSGHFGHSGRIGEVGGSAPSGVSIVRQFATDEEGYGWHEKGKVRDWAIGLSEDDANAITNYAGFSYGDINNTLRGNPPTKTFTREATEEETALMRNRPEEDRFKPIDLGDGKTLRWKLFEAEVEWRDVDHERVKQVKEMSDRINDIIANRGITLDEDTEVTRVAYLPNISVSDLENFKDESGKFEEKGFTSTFLGPAQGRANGEGYLSYGIGESKYKRYGSNDMYHDEVGTAVRFEIVLPKGTKVASAEAARRNYQYTDGTYNLDRPEQRIESEVLLGSGAVFRIDSIEKNKPFNNNWTGGKDIPYVTIRATYVYGGSSQR